MARALRRIAAEGQTLGLKEEVHAYLRAAIERHAEQLETLA
jgi:hypothetical protein